MDTEGQLPQRSNDEDLPLLDHPHVRKIVHDTAHLTHPLEGLGAGDSVLFTDFLTPQEADECASHLQLGGEIQYQQWYHMPDSRRHKPLQKLRRIKVAMAEPNEDGLIPHYRFPVNDQHRYGVFPFSPTIKLLHAKLVARTGIPFNHSVVLLYRDGEDCIGLHQDKTLDLVEGSPVASISFGAERPYLLADSPRNTTYVEEFNFPHGALLMLGAETNARLYHSVRRLQATDQCAGGIRVSVTFRVVGTFRHPETNELHGKGSEYQSVNWPESLRGLHRTDDDLDSAPHEQVDVGEEERAA